VQTKGRLQRAFWFRARPYGYGAGWPLNWKGWALWAAMLAVLAALPYVLHRFFPFPLLVPAAIVAIALVTLPFMWIASGRTVPRRRRPGSGQP
jgi:hypothetical protein